MTDTIRLGKAGRLVIPKRVRETLGMREGTRLRVEVVGVGLRVEPVADDVRIEVEEDGFPVIRGAGVGERGRVVGAIKAGREEREERVAARERGRS